MRKKLKVLAITGIRSEYDTLYPLIDILRKDNNFEVKLVVSGAHLSDWHGFTLKKIEEDGFSVADKIDSLFMTDRKTQRAKAVGTLICALAQTVERENPDFIFAKGDREETIAAAVVGNYMNVLVVHIGGGDPAYGNTDDPIRFAVSKLAHIHFVDTEEFANNLKRIGEEKFRIFTVGDPSMDNIKNTPTVSMEGISNFLDFEISRKNYLVVIKHPLSSEVESSYSQMEVTLKALKDFSKRTNLKVVGIYPNTDPGSYGIIKAMQAYQNEPFIKFYKTLPREIFINLMRNARALAGNSSMGLVEAPSYRLPVINIGKRQSGRLNVGNVEFVDHCREEIIKALDRACFDESYRKYVGSLRNPYGDGRTAQRMKDILLSIDLNDKKWYVKEKLC